MSFFDSLTTTICRFLLTYLVHSTVIVSVSAILVSRVKRFREPLLRVMALKLAIVLPILTTCGVAFLPYPHWGFQFALSEPKPDGPLENETANEATVWPVESGEISDIQPTIEPTVADDHVDFGVEQANVVSIDAEEVSITKTPVFSWKTCARLIALLWFAVVFLGMVRLFVQVKRLRTLRRSCGPVRRAVACAPLDRLAQAMGVSRKVELLESSEVSGALTAGIWRPFILLPVQQDDGDDAAMGNAEWESLLAHELGHILHHDASWNLFVQFIRRLVPFQPLNRVISRQLQIAMDFAADEAATNVVGGQAGLVRCLVQLGEQICDRQSRVLTHSGLVAGMVAFRSPLGQRIERLLEMQTSHKELTQTAKLSVLFGLTIFAMTAAALVPHAVAEKRIDDSRNQVPSDQVEPMKSQLSTLAILVGLTSPVSAEDPQVDQPVQQTQELKATPDELPDGIQRFNGMLVGRLAAKDVEKGAFVVVVDAVPRVWRNSRAENPKSVVGKSIRIEGVFGKFLDVLVTTRLGETIEFECKYDEDALVFPGELLRKVAPYQVEDYPELPEEFRGFRGAAIVEIQKKDPETFELIVKVKKVTAQWKENGAKQPESILGKSLMLAGFWNRKDAYHNLKEGDRIEVGMQHIGRQSDHLTVAEFVRKSDGDAREEMRREEPGREEMKEAGGVRGFRGMLVGRVVKKDVERGTFTITVDAVPRVWNNNKSRNPKALIGQQVDAEGVPQQLLDVLVLTRIGETVQFGALHDEGDSVRVGEVLCKVGPVEKGDYPELPDEFRGFKGVLEGKVVKKDEHLWDMTLEVTEVVRPFEGNRSRNAESIVGKRVMLSGFWNKKDAYHNISVGDKIQTGVDHPQKLGDQLNVIEGIRKLDD